MVSRCTIQISYVVHKTGEDKHAQSLKIQSDTKTEQKPSQFEKLNGRQLNWSMCSLSQNLRKKVKGD